MLDIGYTGQVTLEYTRFLISFGIQGVLSKNFSLFEVLPFDIRLVTNVTGNLIYT